MSGKVVSKIIVREYHVFFKMMYCVRKDTCRSEFALQLIPDYIGLVLLAIGGYPISLREIGEMSTIEGSAPFLLTRHIKFPGALIITQRPQFDR